MAKRGRKPKERKGYFYEKEEQAIIDYINTNNPEEKNQIFNTVLLPALTKMIESIIRRYKLFVPDEEFPQTFNDTISYLLTKINNFKPEMWVYEEISGETAEPPVDLTSAGFVELKKTVNEHSPKYIRVFSDPYIPAKHTWPSDEFDEKPIDDEPLFKLYKLELRHYKAYSYCGTVCKNYLIYKNIQYTKNKQRNLSYDEIIEGLQGTMYDFSKDQNYSVSEDDNSYGLVERLIHKISLEIKTMMDNKEKNCLTDDEIKVGIALTELLDHWEDVLNVDGSNKLQKSSVLYFLREETMMTTKSVRDNMKKFRSAYYLLKKGMLEDE
jgi:hypothetical protein